MQVTFNELDFGVEIEFSGITRHQAAKILVQYFGTTFVKYGDGIMRSFTYLINKEESLKL